jgi:Rrf2 family iron-sulfur cluster assembly transcriptional regulator
VKITSKGRYAVSAMMDLTTNSNDKPVSLADISERQSISLSYLEQLFAKLRRNGLVSSVRGPGGGYVLAKSATDIKISDIIGSVNENIDASACSGRGDCKNGEMCLSHNLWEKVNAHLRDYLGKITLEDALSMNREQSTPSLENIIKDIDLA